MGKSGIIYETLVYCGILFLMLCTVQRMLHKISSLYLKKVRYKKKFGIKRVILLYTVYRLTSLNGIQHLISNIRYNKFFLYVKIGTTLKIRYTK